MKKSILTSIIVSVVVSAAPIDFEESMGKNNSYGHSYYMSLMNKLDNAHANIFLYIKPHNGKNFYNKCKNLYEKNCFLAPHKDGYRIPPILHQIWIGPKPFPEKYKAWQRTWQSLKGWTYKLWTNEDVEALKLINRELFKSETNPGAQSDIVRLEILYQFGGVYVDTDFECLQPDLFDALAKTYDLFSGLSPLDTRTLVVANGLIGAVPKHPVIKACIDLLSQEDPSSGTDVGTDGIKKAVKIVSRGPGLFTKMLLLHVDAPGYRDIIFPATFFYPLGLHQMKKTSFDALPTSKSKFDALKVHTCKPESLAIHWWEGSWQQ